jgi:hypothetical protein
MRAVILTFVLSSLAAPPALAEERSPYRHVRSTQERIQELLDEGSRRSPTFAALRETLESSDVIVYVQAVGSLSAALNGRLAFLRAGNGKRYLRIEVRQELQREQMLSTIGHELQHAVEIAGATEVRDTDSMTGFYRRVGVAGPTPSAFDTLAAREMGRRVRGELRGL